MANHDPRWEWRSAWLADGFLGPVPRHVLHVLVTLPSMGDKGSAYASAEWLGKRMNRSERTVRRALVAAVESGWLSKEKRPGATSVYAISYPAPDSVTGQRDRGSPGQPVHTEAPTPDSASGHPGHTGGGTPDTVTDKQENHQEREEESSSSGGPPSVFSLEEKAKAAEEITRRREEKNPEWSPSTTRYRYVQGISARLEDGEVAEVLGALANKAAEAEATTETVTITNKAKAADDVARSMAQARRRDTIERMPAAELADLDKTCVTPSLLAAATRNPLAAETVMEQRMEHLDLWLRSRRTVPDKGIERDAS